MDTTGAYVYTKGSYIEIVGKGTSDSARSNARTLDWSGNEVLAGKLTVGAAPTANMDVATKQYVDNKVNRTTNVNAADTGYTTYMARGEALNSADTNPTVNGAISWTYA